MSFDCLYGELPREKPMPVCPVCGAEMEIIYLNSGNGTPIGCDQCIDPVDVYIWQADQEPDDDCDRKYDEWKDERL